MSEPNDATSTGEDDQKHYISDGGVKKDPKKCNSCGSEDVRSYPMEDKAVCEDCGYVFLGLPRNKTYGREWTGDEFEDAEVYRDA